MIDVSVSQLVNEVDKGHFTLYVEWQDTYFKIILLRSSMVPLSGEMNTANVNYFLDNLGESFDTYLEKARHAFSGENVEIQFFLQDDLDGQITFTWKQQNILTRGRITVYPLSNLLIISDTLKKMLEQYQRYQGRILTLEKENECLSKTNEKLVTHLEDMINVKNTMEEEFYNRFLLLLNTKKEKIRELQEVIDSKKQATDKSVYDKTTDESEESDEESTKVQDTKLSNIRKRKIDCKSKQNVTPKISRKDFERCTNFSPDKSPSPEPSTSKGKLTLQDKDIKYNNKNSKKSLDTSEEESEDDLFSQ